jgi:drug/metabolite transporter (DMT)-like permease
MSIQLKAHFSLFAAALIFGANYWISKDLMPDYFSPEQLLFFRMGGAFIMFYFFALFTVKEKVDRKDLWRIAIAGFFGTTLNQLLFFIGLNLTTPVDMAIIHVTSPIFVVSFAAILINEKISAVKISGIIMGTAGAVILILHHGEISFSSNTFSGNLMALLNTIAYAVYLVLIKPVMAKYHPVTVMKWVFLFGFLAALPLTIGSLTTFSTNNFAAGQWFGLAYVVIGTTFLAYLLTIFALKYMEAGVVSFYIYLQPLIASGIAFWLGKQDFTIGKGFAVLMIFTGVYLVSKRKNNNLQHVPEWQQQPLK